MEVLFSELDAATQVVKLDGRLDAPGVEKIQSRFTAVVVSGNRNALIDLSAVSFVGSLGLRMLISVARTMQRRGQKMVLFGVDPLVRAVMDSVALGDLIPLAENQDAAAALLAA